MNTLITFAFEGGNIEAYDLSTEEPVEVGGFELSGNYVGVDASIVGKKDIFFVVTEWVEAGTPRKAMVIIHLSNVEEGGSEEPSEGVFSITNASTASSVACTEYAGPSLDWFKQNYGVESIWQVEKPTGSLDVALSTLGKTIASWDCYDFATESPISLTQDEIMDVNGDGSVINIWIGGAFVEHDVVFIVITDNSGVKYGLIVGTPAE